MIRKLLVPLLLAFAVVHTAASAQAANSASTASSIVLNESAPHLGGSVTFTVTYPKTVKSPRVAVRCYQNDSMVYAEAGAAGQSFLLGGASSTWLSNGGPAHCTGELFYFTWNGNNPEQYHSLAWTSFDAAG